MTQITTTLAAIRAAGPCEDGFAKIRDHLGVSPAAAKTHDEPFAVALLLETNSLADTLWVLDNVTQEERICRLFAVDCAERVLCLFEEKYPSDKRPRRAIEMARDPNATADELNAARADACAAAAWAFAEGDVRAAAAAHAAKYAAQATAWTDAGDDAASAAAAWTGAWANARAAARAAQKARLRQYLAHGEAAADMPWPEVEK